MIAETVQGTYAGLVGWRIQWRGDNEEPEVMPGLTQQEILELLPHMKEGAEVVRTVMVDQVIPHTEKDGVVVLDA